MNDEYILETVNLTKKYGKDTVVNQVNIRVPRGTIYGLLGKNGAGKTTTMCMILKLVNKTSGNVNLFGKMINNSNDSVYKQIGSIIETPGFYHSLTGEENLKLFSKLFGVYNEENIKSVLEMVSLTKYKDKLFKNYSLGMKQRLGIALSLIKEPSLLILDEPINGLDPIGIQEMRELLRRLTDDYGITILISSHILGEIEQIADIIGIMDNGVLIEEITMKSLQEKINKHVLIQVDNIPLTEKIFTEIGLIKNNDYIIDNNDNIKLFNYLEDRGSINTHLVKNGVEVQTITLVKENLEEYFTNIIEGEFNA